MSWLNAVIIGCCGIVAAGVASIASRNGKNDNHLYYIIFIITMILSFGASQAFIIPFINAEFSTATTSYKKLLDYSALKLIKWYDQESFNKIKNEFYQAIKEGQSKEEAMAAVHNMIPTFVQKHLPYASDEAAIKYAEVKVQELTELMQNGEDLCYSFIFSEMGQTLNSTKYISDTTREARLAALGNIVRTSFVSSQGIPSVEEVSTILEPVIYIELNKYGQNLALIQEAVMNKTDKIKVCEITIEMYKSLLQLPPIEGSKVIRYLASQK
ncbi:MAG TPA: hypothetical protein VLE21_01500 [Candidatus Nitrosocosmicus sp.]|nr:hypothetical protein [Candidatus Nitrosocosmicus sp.]